MKKLILYFSCFLLLAGFANAGERVLTVGGNQASRPISEFGINVTDVYYVDSVNGDDGRAGKSVTTSLATVDAAINKCTANQGDIIYIMPGDAESFSAANGFDADVAGITIRGLGDGVDMPEFTFADTDATIAIGADSVTIENCRFIAGISEVVVGISVEAAGSNFTMEGCLFPEPTTSTFEFLDAIDLASGVSGLTLDGVDFLNIDGTGGTHFLDAGNGVNNNLTIKDCNIQGEFSVAAIWSDTADLEVLIEDCKITNATNGQHAIEFTAAATGLIRNTSVRTDAQGTAVDPGSLGMHNVLWDADATPDTVAISVVLAGGGAGSISVVPNADGSVFERLEAVGAANGPSYNSPNYFAVTADMTSATWNTAAAHEIAAVTGAVRMQIMIETVATIVTVGTNGTLALGYAGNTAAIYAATALDAALTGDVWTAIYGGVATTEIAGAEAGGSITHAIQDVVVLAGVDVGYTIATNAGTTGSLIFHIWWTPLDATGAVTAGAGGVL